MANSVLHGALPYMVKGARYTIQVVGLGTTGAPANFGTADSEVSKDGAAFADCTEEVTNISTGQYYITLTGDETNCTLIGFRTLTTGTPSATVANSTALRQNTRILPVLESGTAQAGAAGTITLAAAAVPYDLSGCLVRTTGGTGGGGGSGSLNNQVRQITAYDTSTKVATIAPNWETNPASGTTYEILFTELAAFTASVRGGGVIR